MKNIYYVYVYRDPITKVPFYVGKGKGSRIFRHINETANSFENGRKFHYIQELKNQNLQPLIGRYAKNLDEETAYKIEEELIRKWGRKNIDEGGVLLNICINNRPPPSDGINNNCYGLYGKDHPAYGYKNPKYILDKRVKTYIENAKLYGYNQGSKNSRYNDHRTYDELHGLEKSLTLRVKISKRYSGAKNPNARTYEIIDPNGKVSMIKCLTTFCKRYNLNRSMMGKVSRGEIESYRSWKCRRLS